MTYWILSQSHHITDAKISTQILWQRNPSSSYKCWGSPVISVTASDAQKLKNDVLNTTASTLWLTRLHTELSQHWLMSSLDTCYESVVKDLWIQNLAADWYRWHAVWIYERQGNQWPHFYCKTVQKFIAKGKNLFRLCVFGKSFWQGPDRSYKMGNAQVGSWRMVSISNLCIAHLAIHETLSNLLSPTLSHVTITKISCIPSRSERIIAHLLMLFNSIDVGNIVVWNISRCICQHMSCIPPITIPAIYKFQMYTTTSIKAAISKWAWLSQVPF